MKQIIYHNTLILSVLFILIGFLGCRKQDAIAPIDDVSRERVYVSFEIARTHLRAQGSNPSINKDLLDLEDHVRQMVVIFFDTHTGSRVVAKQFDVSTFILYLQPGTYDIYIIANDPNPETLLTKTRDDLDTYLRKPQPYLLTQGKNTVGFSGFPMARIYKSQVIRNASSSYAHPLRFRPHLSASSPLSPVSFFGSDPTSLSSGAGILLVRSCSKIELTLDGPGLSDVQSVEYINAAQDYTLAQSDALSSQSLYGQPLAFSLDSSTTGLISALLYVPERLFTSSEPKGWVKDSTHDQPIGNVSYIKLTMNSGKIYKIPIISYGPDDQTYMMVARDASRANYNVIRNHHYRYAITIPDQDKELMVQYNILPWNTYTLQSEAYKMPTYDIPDGSDPTHTIVPEVKMINGHPTIQFNYSKNVIIPFRLTSPIGLDWKATITNGSDFVITPSVTGGVANGESTPYTNIEIKSRRVSAFTKMLYTEFFITVDSREVPLTLRVKQEDGSYTTRRLYGKGNRLIIQQIL